MLLSLNYNTKKNYCENIKIPLNTKFNFFCFQGYFNYFSIQSSYKNTFCPCIFGNEKWVAWKNSNALLKACVKFFGCRAKNIIILLQWTMFFSVELQCQGVLARFNITWITIILFLFIHLAITTCTRSRSIPFFLVDELVLMVKLAIWWGCWNSH